MKHLSPKETASIVSAKGYLDSTVVFPSAIGTVTLNCATASVFDLTLTGNVILQFTNVPALSGETYCALVRIRQGAQAYTVGQPANTMPMTPGSRGVYTPGAGKIGEFYYSTTDRVNWLLYEGPST